MHSQKELAIQLRKQGKTYSEILRVIPVAKSTLSLWLRDVGLAKRQIQKITEKKRAGQLRGALARKNQRLEDTRIIFKKAQEEIRALTKRDLWLLGIALYWAEGSKQKEYATGIGITFSNSDPKMIQLFVKWLLEAIGVDRETIFFALYIHENHTARLSEIQKKWASVTGFPLHSFARVYYKKDTKKQKRKSNVGALYYGQLQVKVRASSKINRQITGWINGICEYCGFV